MRRAVCLISHLRSFLIPADKTVFMWFSMPLAVRVTDIAEGARTRSDRIVLTIDFPAHPGLTCARWSPAIAPIAGRPPYAPTKTRKLRYPLRAPVADTGGAHSPTVTQIQWEM